VIFFSMSLGDAILEGIIFFIQKLTNLLPKNIPFFSFETYQTLLASVKNFSVVILNSISWFFPVALLFTLLKVIIYSYLALFSFKTMRFLVNLLRGAGA